MTPGTSETPGTPGTLGRDNGGAVTNGSTSGNGDALTTPVLSLIRNIQNGTTEPTLLNPEDRQRCVEHLTIEGYSLVEIAEVLKTAERTIGRDRKQIRKANALKRDPQLVDQMVGNLVHLAETSTDRIRRAIRGRDVPPAVKVQGEKECWSIGNELMARLQSVGYLPTAAREFRGEVTHHVEQAQSYEELGQEVMRLELIQRERGTDDPVRIVELADLKAQLTKGALIERVERLADEVQQDDSDA